MWFRHRHTYAFPIILVVLTLGLIFLLWQTVKPSSQEGNYLVQTETLEPVTVADYEQALQGVMDGFTLTYQQKGDDAERAVYVDGVLQNVLALRVPTEEKDLHLQIAFGLNRLSDGLTQGDEAMSAEGWNQLNTIFADNLWIDSTALKGGP